MDEEATDFGIFLFKNSKSKVSNDSIFHEPIEPEVRKDFGVDFGMKWMKKFLKRMVCPSLLHKPITAVPASQLQTESHAKFKSNDEGEIIALEGKGRGGRITRGNRRHKIKSRRQRNKLKQKSKFREIS